MNAARFFLPLPPGEGRGEGLPPFVLLLVLVLAPAAPAAAPSLAWAARSDGGHPANRHVTLDLLRSPAGHLVVGGTLTRTNGQTAYVVSAFDDQGQPLWRTEHVSTNRAENTLRRIIQDAAGHLLLTGTSDTLRLSPAGAVLWTAPYGGRDVTCDTNGHAYLAGYRTDDIALLKLDAATGTNLWERLYDGPQQGEDHAVAVAVDVAQDIYVLGNEGFFRDHRGNLYMRPCLLKYASDGHQIWYRDVLELLETGSPVGFITAARISPEDSGGIVFLAYGISTHGDSTTCSIDASGQLSWAYFVGYYIQTMKLISGSGPILAGGRSTGYPTYSSRFVTIAVGTNGHKRWQAEYPETPLPSRSMVRHSGQTIAHDPGAGTVIVAGVQPLAWDVTTIATVAYEHAAGRELWHQHYPGPVPGHHEGMGVAVDGRGAVYVAGHSDNAAGGRDLLLLKYAPAAAAAVTPGGDVAVTIPAAPGTPVTLEASTDFAAWSSLGTALAGTNAAARFTDTNAVNRFPQRFYRPRP